MAGTAPEESLSVFIHRSIKTRIETNIFRIFYSTKEMFLYIDPLKQGLKLHKIKDIFTDLSTFLYIDPLKQGLKLPNSSKKLSIVGVFIHRSIKTRIETSNEILYC